MKILDIKTFEGRNIYAHFPVSKITVDLGPLSERESAEYAGFTERLEQVLPGLRDHSCAGQPGGFAARLRSGTYFGHVLEHVFLELQAIAGATKNFGQTRQIGDGPLYAVVVEHACSEAVQPLAALAVDLIAACLENREFELSDKLAPIRSQIAAGQLGPSTSAIARAAAQRGISVRRLGVDSLLQLGTGCFARRVQATVGHDTSCIAVDIAADKTMTKYILAKAGVPVPFGYAVTTLPEALEAWRTIGKPVAVKPSDGNQGRGVSLNVNSEAEVSEAFALARRHGGKLIVEEYIVGRHYRVLVVGGKLAAASERTPAHVVGDGHHSVEELVAAANQDPRRGEHHEKPLTRMIIDELALGVLRKQGHAPTTVPAPGEVVFLRGSANLSTGGTATDVTSLVHPSVAELTERVARLIGLDIAGIDLVMPDIACPLTQGAIIEVNAAPGIRMHLYPSEGQAREVAGAIVDMLFPPGQRSEVPLITVTGTNGKTTTTRLIAAGLRRAYTHVGYATSAGIYINDRLLVSGDTTGPWSAGVLLGDPLVQAVALEVARGGIIRGGLGYNLADVAVVTNVTEDHLGQDGVRNLDDLCHVKALVAEAVRPGGKVVVNAENEYSLRAGLRSGREMVLFGQERNELLSEHLAQGGCAVFVENGSFHVVQGGEVLLTLAVNEVPLVFGGKARHNLENCAAALAALYSLGVPLDECAEMLRQFRPDLVHNPGRQNIIKVAHASVLVDYGHNVKGLECVAELARGLCRGRLLGVVCAPGDRTDESIVQLGQMAGAKFDALCIKEDKDLRGRNPGEVAALLQAGAAAGGAAADIAVVLDERQALRESIAGATADDLVVVFYESLPTTLDHLGSLAEEFGAPLLH
jgi:cyanophycin synthetase